MPYRAEFPDFDPATMPAIPAGFDDVSWCNDSCPSFVDEGAGMILFIDFADPADREVPERPRFSVGEWDGGATGVELFCSDEWPEVESFLADARRAAA